jgi:hypothetical protein
MPATSRAAYSDAHESTIYAEVTTVIVTSGVNKDPIDYNAILHSQELTQSHAAFASMVPDSRWFRPIGREGFGAVEPRFRRRASRPRDATKSSHRHSPFLKQQLPGNAGAQHEDLNCHGKPVRDT